MKKISVPLLFLFVAVFSCDDEDRKDRALRLNGVSDFVYLGDIYDDLQLPLTISAWVKVDQVDLYAPIFVSQDNIPGYTGFMFMVTPDGLSIQYGDGLGENHPAYRRGKHAPIPNVTGQWLHVTGVMRGAEDMDLYVNGEKLSGTYSGTSQLPMESNSPEEVAKIGYWYSNGIVSHFKGAIDNLNLWKRSLSEEEIIETMCGKLKGNESGLIGYWTFNESSGMVVQDKSPNKFHGTISGEGERIELDNGSKPPVCN